MVSRKLLHISLAFLGAPVLKVHKRTFVYADLIRVIVSIGLVLSRRLLSEVLAILHGGTSRLDCSYELFVRFRQGG